LFHAAFFSISILLISSSLYSIRKTLEYNIHKMESIHLPYFQRMDILQLKADFLASI